MFKRSLREHKDVQTTIVEYIKHVWGNSAFSGPSLEGYVAKLKLSWAKGVLYCYRLCGLKVCWLFPVVCLSRVLFFTPLDGNYSKGTWFVILTPFCKHKLQMTNNQAAYIPFPFSEVFMHFIMKNQAVPQESSHKSKSYFTNLNN